MKVLSLTLLVLLSSAATPPPAPVRVTFTPLTKAAYLQAVKSRIVMKPGFTFPLRKQGGRIVIPTSKGKRVFRDGWVEGQQGIETSYKYLGYWPALHWHIVESYEYGEVYTPNVITQKGQWLKLSGYPDVSPDTSRFVVASGALDGLWAPGIQLFRPEKGIWKEVWKIAPKTWQVEQLDWIAPDALLLQKRHWSKDFSRSWYTYARLTLHQEPDGSGNLAAHKKTARWRLSVRVLSLLPGHLFSRLP